MAKTREKLNVYLEIGTKRIFAGAIDWPGWCRSGRDEESALRALFDYGPRYAQAMQNGKIEFHSPNTPSDFAIVERLEGDATTDFGAPSIPPAYDTEPVDAAELTRLTALLQACWQTFDKITHTAAGKELRAGPRGGGRQLEKILWHVVGAEAGYLASLGGKTRVDEMADATHEYALVRQAVLDTLPRAARGEIPARGPRGGLRWTPRYFVRRLAWHVLDHAWEIEDRLVKQPPD